jgi:hypothetical protein
MTAARPRPAAGWLVRLPLGALIAAAGACGVITAAADARTRPVRLVNESDLNFEFVVRGVSEGDGRWFGDSDVSVGPAGNGFVGEVLNLRAWPSDPGAGVHGALLVVGKRPERET